MVEAGNDHYMRHAGRRDHSRAGEDFHIDEFKARAGGSCFVARGWGITQYPFRFDRWKLQRVLDGARNCRTDGNCLCREWLRPG